MDDYGSAQDLPYAKMVCQEYLKRAPVIPQQRRKIPSVAGMRAAVRVIMSICVCERVRCGSAAVASTVDMKAKKLLAAWLRSLRKSAYLRGHQNTLCRLVKTHNSVNLRVFGASGDHGPGIGAAAKDGHNSKELF